MKYQLPDMQQQAIEYFNQIINKTGIIEVKMVRKRTLKQNAYLHALFALFASEQGYAKHELENCKQDVKFALNYAKEIDGQVYYISTADMNTKQLALFIDKFRDWSLNEMDCYLPAADEMTVGLLNIGEYYE